MRVGVRTVAAVTLATSVGCLPPEWGAAAILHPMRRPLVGQPELSHEDVSWRTDDGLLLRGWLFRTTGPRRGLIVYLHGIADNRRSGIGVAKRFVPKGWDVLAYDSRAHGQSEGNDCTYGFREKRDLSRALDTIKAERGVVAFGSSLGAAVALQAAPTEPRLLGVIAQSSFSDLETIVRDRAPWIATPGEVQQALRLAEQRAGFRVADISPKSAAALIRVPVLLIHGARDRETPPAHSQRIYDALAGRRRILLVPGAGHNDTLAREEVWNVIEDWLERLDSAGRSLITALPPQIALDEDYVDARSRNLVAPQLRRSRAGRYIR